MICYSNRFVIDFYEKEEKQRKNNNQFMSEMKQQMDEMKQRADHSVEYTDSSLKEQNKHLFVLQSDMDMVKQMIDQQRSMSKSPLSADLIVDSQIDKKMST